ncbi:hypothetical protein [Antarcticimicrobium sediminis]|uniref:hypothetical protein n=1 Tax=Antarcticimicrobium sediminis TaxID=2546227 RepID=UPI001404DE35|nr:hypothetical protein [Antarcticimicrobium sediminis]
MPESDPVCRCENSDARPAGADLSGYVGSSVDEMIETNTADETYQVIEGGGGDDVVEAGMGTWSTCEARMTKPATLSEARSCTT